MVFQVGYDNAGNDQISVSIRDVSPVGLNYGSGPTVDTLDISTVSGSQSAMSVLDNSIDQVSANRANLGATQNRLQTTITNLATARENIAAANSRIRDVDVAAETVEPALSCLRQVKADPNTAMTSYALSEKRHAPLDSARSV